MKKTRIFTALVLAAALLCPVRGSPRLEKRIALTFDDGPSGAVTGTLLEGLRQRNIQATFFLCAYRIAENPDSVPEMEADGHELGIHGFSHDYFIHMTPRTLEQEMDETARAIRELTGKDPTLLRPPGGLYDERVLNLAKKRGYPVILWSVDPEDWDPAQRCFTVDRVLRRAEDGDVILLHDLSEENVRSALQIVDRLQAQGFTFCTVSELAEAAGTALLPGTIYKKFSP